MSYTKKFIDENIELFDKINNYDNLNDNPNYDFSKFSVEEEEKIAKEFERNSILDLETNGQY